MNHTLHILPALFFLLSNTAESQTPLYPDVYASYAVNKSVTSPSYIPEEGKYGLSGVYKFKVGETNLALYDVNATLSSGQEDKNKRTLRLSFYNEKEGPYISSPRAYANYAYRVQLSEQSSLGAGVSIGFVSKLFSAPSATGVGNLFLPDGNIGFEFLYRDFRISAAIYQVFQSRGQAIGATLLLHNYYQFYMDQVVVLSDNWLLTPQLFLRILPEVTNQWIGGLGFIYNKQITLSTIYTQRRGVAFQASMKFENQLLPVQVSVLYNSSLLSQTPVWLNSTELGFNYMN